MSPQATFTILAFCCSLILHVYFQLVFQCTRLCVQKDMLLCTMWIQWVSQALLRSLFLLSHVFGFCFSCKQIHNELVGPSVDVSGQVFFAEVQTSAAAVLESSCGKWTAAWAA